MITRIVRMSFDPEKVDEFKSIFMVAKPQIRKFNGCHGVKLLNQADAGNVFFTLSIWESEDHLNDYRSSELFNSTWSKTKILFNEKPQAWTLDELDI